MFYRPTMPDAMYLVCEWLHQPIASIDDAAVNVNYRYRQQVSQIRGGVAVSKRAD